MTERDSKASIDLKAITGAYLTPESIVKGALGLLKFAIAFVVVYLASINKIEAALNNQKVTTETLSKIQTAQGEVAAALIKHDSEIQSQATSGANLSNKVDALQASQTKQWDLSLQTSKDVAVLLERTKDLKK